jgi:hypothetical protein
MGSVSVGGFIARVIYLSLCKMHQIEVHGYFKTAILTPGDTVAENSDKPYQAALGGRSRSVVQARCDCFFQAPDSLEQPRWL